MATGAVPVRIRAAVSLFNRKFTPGDATSRRDVPFTAGVRGFFTNSQVKSKATSYHKYEVAFAVVRLAAHVSNGLKSRIRPVAGRI